MRYLLLALFCIQNVYAVSLSPTKALPVEKYLVTSQVTIAGSGTTTSAINTQGLSLVGIQLPAAFTGTSLSFLGSLDCVSYQPVYTTTSGTLLSYTVAQAHYVVIDPVPFYGLKCVKLVSGSTESGRTIPVSLKGI